MRHRSPRNSGFETHCKICRKIIVFFLIKYFFPSFFSYFSVFQISGMRDICGDKELASMLCEKLTIACKEDGQQCEQAMFRVCSLLINMNGRSYLKIW